MSRLNASLQRYAPLKEQATRISAIVDGLLALHAALGTIFAQVDTTEAQRAVGGVSVEQFTELRAAVDRALQAVDASIHVAIAVSRTAIATVSDMADEINGMHDALGRLTGGNPAGGRGGNSGLSH